MSISVSTPQLVVLIGGVLSVGVIVGVLLVSILIVSKRSDEEEEEMGLRISQIEHEPTKRELAWKIKRRIEDGIAVNQPYIAIVNDVLSDCDEAIYT